MPEKTLPDWNNLAFAYTETDFFYYAEGDTRRDPVWDEGEILPSGPIEISPAAAFLSYGIGIFEGLKAQRSRDGRVLLFRHRQNAERFRRSAERLHMSLFPADRFVQAVEEVTRRNFRWVPPHGKGSLYIRPLEHAVEPKLGLSPCSRFTVTVFTCPVGAYFAKSRGPAGPEGVRLKVLEQGRVAPGGTGAAKAIGNYAGGISIAHHWKEKGFDDVLYLDSRHLRFITETSGSNIFVKLKGGALVTPPLDDQILAGITRDSVIQVARKHLGVAVEERPIDIDEALGAEEVFCTGTAWTLQSVRELVHRAASYAFPKQELRKSLLEMLRGIQTGEREDPFGWTTEVQLERTAVRR